MIKYKNECRDCVVPGYPCIGSLCRYINVPYHYCDECNIAAPYRIYGQDYCKEHTEEYLQEAFDELTISEKAKLLGIRLDEN